MKDKFTGIFPALLTPFKINGDINESSLRKLVRLNIEKGVSGFYVGGSTAEAFLMSLDERKKALEIVVDETHNDATVIAHVGTTATAHSLELAHHAESVGVDAISAVAPFYYKYTFDEIKTYYLDIVNSVDVPMIIYNFPNFSGVTLSADNARALLEHQNIIGIKHTSNDFFALERFKRICEDIIVFNGFDEMFLSGLIAGADGGIGSTYNFMAEKFIEMQRLFNNGEIEKARKIQQTVNIIIDAMIPMGVMQAEKAILSIMGIEMGECRKPFSPITNEQYEQLKQLVEKYL